MSPFTAIYQMLIQPKKTMLALPSEKYYIPSFFIVLTSNLLLAVHSNLLIILEVNTSLHFFFFFFFFTLVTAAIFFLQYFFIDVILTAFKKKLNMPKILNLIGYAAAPSLFIFFVLYGTLDVLKIVNQDFVIRQVSIINTVIDLLINLTGLYTYVLLIYGLIIMPKETGPAADIPASPQP